MQHEVREHFEQVEDTVIVIRIETLQIFRIIRELTPEIIRVFVERIEIFKPEQMNGHRVQKMRIVWNCIEEFMPLQPQNNKKSA